MESIHPEIFEQFSFAKVDVSGRFVPKTVALDQQVEAYDPELMQLLGDFEALIIESGKSSDAVNNVHLGYLQLLQAEAFYGWKAEIALANMKQICGEHRGISGIATWNRVEKETRDFDKKSFALEFPELEKEFSVTTTTNSLVVQKNRGYEFEPSQISAGLYASGVLAKLKV